MEPAWLSAGGLKRGGVLPSVVFATTPKDKDTAVTYSTHLCLLLTTLLSARIADAAANADAPAPPPLDDHLRQGLQQILDLVERFRTSPLTPAATLQFEQQLQL